MTNELKVEQADIDCFKAIFDMEEAFMDIEGDDARTLQILARHRLTAQSPTEDEVEWARKEGFEAGVDACKDKLKRAGFNNVDAFFEPLLHPEKN